MSYERIKEILCRDDCNLPHALVAEVLQEFERLIEFKEKFDRYRRGEARLHDVDQAFDETNYAIANCHKI